MNKDNFLTIIKNKRESLRLSQTELANKLEITQSQYGKLESGKSQITLEQFIQICEILGLSWESFREDKQEEKNILIDDIQKLLNRLKLL